MAMRVWMKIAIVVVALCVAGMTAQAQSQGSSQQSGRDPVADAARKAREDKKNAAKPKKVYTDNDVKPAAAAAPDNTAAGATATAGAAATAGASSETQRTDEAAPKKDPNGEKAWRKRFKDQRDKLAKAETELDVLQRESQKLQIEYYPDPQKALSEQNSRKDVNEKMAKIKAKQQEIAQLKQGLEDMEVQLRKSGGDPGWAR